MRLCLVVQKKIATTFLFKTAEVGFQMPTLSPEEEENGHVMGATSGWDNSWYIPA